MAEKKTYLIVQSVLCVLLCVLLAASAVSIYREGGSTPAKRPRKSSSPSPRFSSARSA